MKRNPAMDARTYYLTTIALLVVIAPLAV